jgi:AcrR family transcriptional regulator
MVNIRRCPAAFVGLTEITTVTLPHELSAQIMRKQPTQKRAQLTIDAIFEATSQIVDREGVSGLTTNKIAAKAGFSVGTLYQYFSSKEAIFRAMSQHGRSLVLRELESYLFSVECSHDPEDITPEVFVRRYVQICIQGFALGKNYRRAMNRLCWLLEQPEETALSVQQMVNRLMACLKYLQHPLLPVLDETQTFVLSRSLMGCLRSASLERFEHIETEAFEDQMVDLLMSQLMRNLVPA